MNTSAIKQTQHKCKCRCKNKKLFCTCISNLFMGKMQIQAVEFGVKNNHIYYIFIILRHIYDVEWFAKTCEIHFSPLYCPHFHLVSPCIFGILHSITPQLLHLFHRFLQTTIGSMLVGIGQHNLHK